MKPSPAESADLAGVRGSNVVVLVLVLTAVDGGEDATPARARLDVVHK